MARPAQAPAVRLIVLYKLVKGALELTAATTLLAGASLGLAAELGGWAQALQLHVVRAWALHAAERLQALATPTHLRVAAVALALDGALTLLEGWSLRRGRWWGPWVVVLATGSLLPLEVARLARAASAGRALLLLANAAMVAFLAWHALRGRAPAAQRPNRS